MTMRAEVFERYKPFQGIVPAGYTYDFVGTLTPSHFSGWKVFSEPTAVIARFPTVDEEYFEWIDLLESVENADSLFVMAELGAGYGRWACRGAAAARAKGKEFHLILAEAEPRHVEWAHEHLANNGVTAAEYILFPVAIGAGHGTMPFSVEMPESNSFSNPKDWYGQLIMPSDLTDRLRDTGRTYLGHSVKAADGWGLIVVEVVPLVDILATVEHVDLIDIDVQGAEADIIAESIKVLNAKVKRLYIGTHSSEIESRLRSDLSAAEWFCIHDYPCLRKNVRTPFGPVDFNDGVQGWINPRWKSQR
jgi:FkbM family methyltransferase